MQGYIHGYSDQEATRLDDQASVLELLLHEGLRYPPGSLILEGGCGTGSQTLVLARNHPDCRVVAVDRSAAWLRVARARLAAAGLMNVTFAQADLASLPWTDERFDHVFLCFVLEHLADPIAVLAALGRLLRPGGTLVAIEGDHGSYACHPRCEATDRVVQAMIRAQAVTGGNALLGRGLSSCLRRAGFSEVRVEPRTIYADGSRPDLQEGFTKRTFAAMAEDMKETILRLGLVDEQTWEAGLAGLAHAAAPDGTFSYTFFRARGVKAAHEPGDSGPRG